MVFLPTSFDNPNCIYTGVNWGLYDPTRIIVLEFLCEVRLRKRSFTIVDSNPLANLTQWNMDVLVAEMVNLVFHNKVIDKIAMKRLISILLHHFRMVKS